MIDTDYECIIHYCDNALHTHGLKEMLHNKAELELVLPFSYEDFEELINLLLEDGRILTEDMTKGEYNVDGIPMRFRLMEPYCGSGIKDEKVLRIAIADSNFRYPGDEHCMFPYSEQYQKQYIFEHKLEEMENGKI